MNVLREFEFSPPDRIWSSNDERRMHHHERANLVRTWKDATKLYYQSYCNYAGLPKACPPALVVLNIPTKTMVRHDPHNYCGTVLKAVIDGLVQGGAWPDDTPDFVDHRQPIMTKGEYVRVVLHEL